MSAAIKHRGTRLVTSLWRQQKGRFFCISTKTASGKWKDYFFEKHQFGEIEEFLEDHEGEDIYFAPMSFKVRARHKEEVVLPKLCWADMDEADPRKIDKRLRPTIALESSPGRFVGLWVLDDRNVSESLNKRLSYQIGADRGGWDLTQVLRFPGTKNYKYKPRPDVRVLWSDGDTYDYADIDRRCADLDEEEEETGVSARDLLKKYGKRIMPQTRRAILGPTPVEGQRSSVVWKAIQELIECGVDEDDALIIMSSAPVSRSKYEGRNMQRALRSQIEKAVAGKLRGVKPTRSKADDNEGDEDEEDDYNWLGSSLAEVEAEEIDWVVFPILARGEITIIEGMPDVGKSFLTQMICGKVVDGKRFPSPFPSGKPPTQGPAAYFDLENSASRVTKPRVLETGIVNLKDWYQEERPFSIGDEDAMEGVMRALRRIKPAVVVFDTLNTYIGGSTDTGQSNTVTAAMNQFKLLARSLNCAVVVLRHWTKGREGRDVREFGQGNMAILGAARVTIAVKEHPERDDFPDTRVALIVKNNLGPKPRNLGLFYDIEKTKNHGAKIVLDGWRDIDDSFMAAPSAKPGEKPKKSGAKEAFEAGEAILVELLKDRKLIPIARLRARSERAGITWEDLVRVAEKMGVKRLKDGWMMRD